MTDRSTSSTSTSTGSGPDTTDGGPDRARRTSAVDVSRSVFLATVALLVAAALFLGGILFAQREAWPYREVALAFSLLDDARVHGRIAPKHALNPAADGASREEWNALVPEALLPGYRAIAGYLPDLDAFAVRIFDERGTRVHERVLDYSTIDPDGPSDGSESPHAFLFLADGSVIVNVDKGDAIARYDVCGQPLWSREGAFHHSLALDPAGGIWTWQGEESTFDQHQALVRFDPDTGATLETIDLFEDIIDASPESRLVFSVAPGETLRRGGDAPDLFHPNDLEVLTPAMADAFPGFEAGDLLASFRNLDLVVVVDRDSHALKWWSHGPWHRQHDPDFLPDGRISVFDNDTGHGTSNIVRIDPATGALDVLDIAPGHRFYTRFMGKHETLEDGTVQIVVPYEGRVLEVAPDGRVLLDIENVHDADYNGLVADAAWLAPDFFEVAPERFACENG